jgi:glycosyltransferase involved in cell wall biosynthesis
MINNRAEGFKYTSTILNSFQSVIPDFANKAKFHQKPQILFITSYPPRECGIATYSKDLVEALDNKFNHSFNISICPLESHNEQHLYDRNVKYILNTDQPDSYVSLVQKINNNPEINIVLIQHEFGFFEKCENSFHEFIQNLIKPVLVVFHTVLPRPDENFRRKVQFIANAAQNIIVMTNASKNILKSDYGISDEKLSVIHHGTHLVDHSNRENLKEKHNVSGKIVLSTFGLLNAGKGIETTIKALPEIIKYNKNVVFLILGKTHPTVLKNEGEKYRNKLQDMVTEIKLQPYVKFVNQFLQLDLLLEYLQLTDVYLFTSIDPNQAVSGTFVYAISCGCPIVSTPIPHAIEVLSDKAGIVIDFNNSTHLSSAVIRLLSDESLRSSISNSGLHKMASTAWENSAIAHARLIEKMSRNQIFLKFNLPEIRLNHLQKLTTDFGMIQFSKLNQPDIQSGYTLDDNARALIVVCKHYELTRDPEDINFIKLYYRFIKFCNQTDGTFLNYVNEEKCFTDQNYSTNLEDSNGRAIWALGYLLSMIHLLPESLDPMRIETENMLKSAFLISENIHSTRAMSFIIKGLYYKSKVQLNTSEILLVRKLASRLVQMYRHEEEDGWQWFECYLTYANSIIPEALLCAWLVTGEPVYKKMAQESFDFLLSKIFNNNQISVISNKGWMQKASNNLDENIEIKGGEQPIDVAYTIEALNKFYDVFKNQNYFNKLKSSFNWFLGHNHLQQIVYNPRTGGCYDGLEEFNINLNQGAESTVSYLMARITIEKVLMESKKITFLTATPQHKELKSEINSPAVRTVFQ